MELGPPSDGGYRPPSNNTRGQEIVSRKRSVLSTLMATKSIDTLVAQSQNTEMHKTLGVWDLTAVGVGEIVGTGIFVLTGTAAADHAGPAVVISFLIAGVASMLAALCYSELASVIPVAGSAYTYSYATLGSLVAWTIGWDLCLEYLVGAATVCVGWSAYLRSFLRHTCSIEVPREWSSSPIVWDPLTKSFHKSGAFMDLPALLISLLVTALLVVGVKESTRVNNVVVCLKLAVVVIFIFAMAPKVDPQNWVPFIPPNDGTFGHYGVTGILQGASVVFFSYIGFDSVSCMAQECKDVRDIPRGTLSSLAVCTVLYIAVALIATGCVPYTQFKGIAHPISYAAELVPGYNWLVITINIGAIAGLTSVILVSLMSQPRIFYSMAVDGFMPPWAAKIHPRFKTPHVTTILSGVLCALCAAVLPINVLSELTSVGTLFAFVLVCLGVLVLRYKQPDLPRRFKVPGGPIFVPLLGALTSGLLICTATVETLYRLVAWMAIGWLIYAFYGYKRSARELEQSEKPFPNSAVSPHAKVAVETEEDINGALAAARA